MLLEADLDGTTVDGTNEDLNDPIGSALRDISLTVADITEVADSDLSAVSSDTIDKFLTYAELRTLETIATSLVVVDVSVGGRSEALSQLATRVELAIERLLNKLRVRYGEELGSLETDTLVLDIADKNETLY